MGTTFSKVKLKDGSIRQVKDAAARQSITDIQNFLNTQPQSVTIMPAPSVTEANNIYQYIGSTTNEYHQGDYYVCVYDQSTESYIWEPITYTVEEINEITQQIYNTIEAESIQVEVMPDASTATVGKIYQYIGATNANYTNGYFYKCVEVPLEGRYTAPDGNKYYYKATSVNVNNYWYTVYSNQRMCFSKERINSSGGTSYYLVGAYNDHVMASIQSRSYYAGCDYWMSYPSGQSTDRNTNYMVFWHDETTPIWNNSFSCLTENNPEILLFNTDAEAYEYILGQDRAYKWQRIDTQPQPDPIQVTVLPTASAEYVGKVYQYIGQTNLIATKGFFYWCSADPYPGSYDAPDGNTYSYKIQTTGQNNFRIYSNQKLATYTEALNPNYGYRIYAKQDGVVGTITYLNSNSYNWHPQGNFSQIVVCSSSDTQLTGNWAVWASANGADGIPIFDTYEEMEEYLNSPIYKWYQLNVQPEGEAPCITQAYILPTPASTNLNHVYQYMGLTTEDYTNKAFYMVVYKDNAYQYEQVLYTVEEVNDLVSGVNENNLKELYIAETPGFSSNDIELDDYISKYMYLMVETISPAATQEDIDVAYIDKLADLDVGDTFTVTDSKNNTITFGIKDNETIEVVSYSTSCPLYISKVTGIRFGTTGQGNPGVDERLQDVELALGGHTVGTDVPANAQFGYDDTQLKEKIGNLQTALGVESLYPNYFYNKDSKEKVIIHKEFPASDPDATVINGYYDPLLNEIHIDEIIPGSYLVVDTYGVILSGDDLYETKLSKNLPNGNYKVYNIIDSRFVIKVKGSTIANPDTAVTIATLNGNTYPSADTFVITDSYDYTWLEVELTVDDTQLTDFGMIISVNKKPQETIAETMSRPKVPKYDASFYDHQYSFYGDGDSQSASMNLHDGCFAVSASANYPSDDPNSPLPPATLQEVKVKGWDKIEALGLSVENGLLCISFNND